MHGENSDLHDIYIMHGENSDLHNIFTMCGGIFITKFPPHVEKIVIVMYWSYLSDVSTTTANISVCGENYIILFFWLSIKINPTLWRFGDNPFRIDWDVYDRFE